MVRVGLDLGDGDQRQAQVADLLEQAVQRGLVDDRTAEHGRAVVGVGEGEAVEPGGPPAVEMPGEPDLVGAGLVRPAVEAWVSLMGASACSACDGISVAVTDRAVDLSGR